MPQLDPTYFPALLFWLIVIFAALYYVLSKNALPKLTEVMEERSARIAGDLDKAERAKREAEAVLAEQEKSLETARSDARAAMAQAQQEAASQSAARMADMQAEADQMIAAANAEIAQATEAAKAQIGSIAAEITNDLVVKVGGAAPTADAARQAVDAAIARRAEEAA